MATIALQTVGTIFLGPLGGMAGAAIGSYIDQNYLMPALFPQDPVQGPRLSDLKFSSASEGDPSAVTFGITRVAGTVIYLGPLIQEKHEEDAGGKGGGGQTVITYDYFVDVAVGFCMNEVENFDFLFADGKKVWGRVDDTIIDYLSPDPSTDFEVNVLYELDGSGNFLDFTAQIDDASLTVGNSTVDLDSVDRTPEVDEFFQVAGDPNGYVVVSYVDLGGGTGTLTFRPPMVQLWADNDFVNFSGQTVSDTHESIVSHTGLGAPDLTVFKSGADVTVTGFSLAENNGVFRCVQSGNGPSGDTFIKLRNDGARPQTDDSARLVQENPAFWSGLADDITLYYGTQDQLPDPLIESFEGVGDVPGYRGTAYVVVTRLKLGDFGNRVPNFEAIIRENGQRQLKDVFSTLLERAGYKRTEYDVTGLGAF